MAIDGVVLSGGAGFCNAVRRSLLTELSTWAPREVVLRVNTSCQTDEFLAHRIGLCPFRRVAEGGHEMTLRRTGPCVVTTADLTGPFFDAVHGGIEIVTLGEGHEVDLTVRFDERQAKVHARYSPCAAVGMERLDGDGRHRLSFAPLDPARTHRICVLEALDALDRMVDDALQRLAHQPETPPVSRC